MSNPIKASDLYQDDGALTAAIKQLQALQVAIDELRKESVSLAVQVKEQNATQASGREEIARTAKQADILAGEHKKLKDAYSDTNKEVQRLRLERTKANQIAKAEAKLAESAAGSYDALSAQYTLNKIKLNAMSDEQRKATKAGQELEAATNGIYQEMKSLQEATGKTALNVGNYKDGVVGAIKGSLGLEKAFALISKTPLIAIVSLIVTGLGALFKAFTRSERGAALMAKASGALEGIMSLLVKAADKVATVLIGLWEDPVQGINDLWAAIKENLVNRLGGLVDLLNTVGSGFKALFTLDLPALKKAAQDAATAMIQLSTGMDAAAQKEFSDAINETVVAMANLDAKRREVIKANRELTKEAEAFATAEQLSKVIADDATRSFAEREAAAEKSRKALEDRASVEVRIARNNLGLIEQEIAIRKANGEAVEDLLDQQLSAFQALTSAQREYTVTVADNEKTRRELVQDRLERDLDILIDGFDNVKTINERIIADETETFERRRAILSETARLSDESFARQIETIQQFTGVQVDANSLVAESDSVALNARIRALGLSEIIEGRLLEIIRERRLAVSDLADAQKELTAATKESFAALQTLVSGAQTAAIEQQRAQSEEVLQMGRKIAAKVKEDMRQEGSTGISGLLGLGTEDQKAVDTALDSAKQSLVSFQQQRQQAAQAAVQSANQEIQAAQARLQAEIDAAGAGYASRVETARAELALAKKSQQEALRQQQQAQRAQLAAQSIEQASNLITAISKLWVKPGWPLALPLSATLFASFAAAKIKAFQAAKIFREGGYEVLEGGSHSSGRDIPLGVGPDGRQRRAEGGEGMAIFSRKATAKYGTMLPQLVSAINRGEFERRYSAMTSATDGLTIGGAIVNVNTAGVETRLDALRRDGQRRVYQDGRGRTVEQVGNRKITYV